MTLDSSDQALPGQHSTTIAATDMAGNTAAKGSRDDIVNTIVDLRCLCLLQGAPHQHAVAIAMPNSRQSMVTADIIVSNECQRLSPNLQHIDNTAVGSMLQILSEIVPGTDTEVSQHSNHETLLVVAHCCSTCN